MGVDIPTDKIASNVFDNFKKITPGLLAVALLSGALLFLPQSVLAKMSLDNLSDTAKRIAGIVFLLSSITTVVIVLHSTIETLTEKIIRCNFRRAQRKKLEKLSNRQKQIIVEMMNSPDMAIQLDSSSGDVAYLQTNLFIHPPVQVTSVDYDNKMVMIYVPHPWLVDLYNKKPELFRLNS